ncbi:MAG: hypothetical protein ACE5R4_02900 [Armatimonadota bacterium]
MTRDRGDADELKQTAARLGEAFPDGWSLLNAPPGAVAEQAGSVFASGQVRDFEAFVACLRVLYSHAARGSLLTRVGKARTGARAERARAEVEEAELRRRQLVQRYYGHYVQGFVPGPEGFVAVWARVPGPLASDSEADRALAPSLFWILRDQVNELLMALPGANPQTLTVCEHCGALAPRGRASKRFCSTRCRVAAFRRRRDEQPSG